MINMYSTGMMCGYNSHQFLKSKYGIGYEDFATTPRVQPYSMSYTPRTTKHVKEESVLLNFLKKVFN